MHSSAHIMMDVGNVPLFFLGKPSILPSPEPEKYDLKKFRDIFMVMKMERLCFCGLKNQKARESLGTKEV